MPILRSSLIAVAVVLLSLGAAALAGPPAPADAGATRVRLHPRIQVQASFDGLDQALAPAVYAANVKVHADEDAARQAAAAAQHAKEAASQKASQASASPRSTTSASPRPVNSGSGCAYSAEIHAAFGGAGDWAVSIAMRESHCTTYTQGAYNPSPCGGGNHAVGLFQLCMPMHADLYPCDWHSASAACEIQAAVNLYHGAGTNPWRL